MKRNVFILFFWFYLINSVFAQHSVLSTGNWYKFGVKGEGVYCITASDLVSIFTFPIANAKNIQLYGNKTGMLPLRFDKPHIDDLREIAITIKGETDGTFDNGDTIFFYAPSSDLLIPDLNSKTFSLQKNIYSDSVYFFLTIGSTQGKRMNQIATLPVFTNTSSTYNEFYWHEVDSVNLIRSGKEWYGEKFDIGNVSSRYFNFDISHIAPGDSLIISAKYAGRNINFANTAYFEINSNAITSTKIIPIVNTNIQDPYATKITDTFSIGPPINSGTVSCRLLSNDSSAAVFLDYLSLNFISSLDIYRPQQLFTDLNSIGPGNVTNYNLNSSNLSLHIWDVTDPVNPADQLFNLTPTISFNASNDSLHTYLAFDNQSYLLPGTLRLIPNQDLHSLSQADYLIITSGEFVSEANTLAAFRQSHDGLQSSVVTTDQIYNEYSAGSQDPAAVRNFIRHIYDTSATSGDSLRYVLLFGGGSYDYRDRLGFHSSFVPSYQSNESLRQIGSSTYEEFYTYMEDTATDYYLNKPAFGIGRIPATNFAEASVVNRIMDYSNANTFGDWRKKFVAISDDQDMNIHFKQVDTICNRLENFFCGYDITKIHIDAYPQITSPTGQRYPDVNSEISSWLNRGCLAIEYIGHGGKDGWAHERILDTTMLQTAANNNRSPLIISVTAEVNRFDDPSRNYCGKIISTNSVGPGIASISDSRIGFSSSNYNLFQRFDSILFETNNNLHLRLGDIWRLAKLKSSDPYTQSFCLLGDPALTLNYPSNEIVITAINGNLTSSVPDTLIPGQMVQIEGEVRDLSGNLMTNFNGLINLLLFDQISLHMTLGNDSGGFDKSIPAPYYSWDDTVDYVTASVTNGIFSASFNISWDLDSANGNGKLSTYAFDQ